MTLFHKIRELLDGICVSFNILGKLKWWPSYMHFPMFFLWILPGLWNPRADEQLKMGSLLPSYMWKEIWLCGETFNISSTFLMGKHNPVAFLNGTPMKTNIDVISFVLRVPFNSKWKEWYLFLYFIGFLGDWLSIVLVICSFAFRSAPCPSLDTYFPRLPC